MFCSWSIVCCNLVKNAPKQGQFVGKVFTRNIVYKSVLNDVDKDYVLNANENEVDDMR